MKAEKKKKIVNPNLLHKVESSGSEKKDLDNSLDQGIEDSELQHGDDAIEIEGLEGEKIVYGTNFSPKDGDLGDESEDEGDLPSEMRQTGRRYDPTLSTGKDEDKEEDELIEGIHIADEDEIGMAYGEDKYIEEEDAEGEDSRH